MTGLLWYSQLLWKAPPNFGTAKGNCPTSLSATGLSGLCAWMHREAAHPIHADISLHIGSASIGHVISTDIYANFVKNVAIPHFALFGWLTIIIEVCITISVTFGLFARLGGLAGALWALNLLVGLWSVPGEWYWTYVMLAMLNLVVFATRSNRYFGLDGLLLGTPGRLGRLARSLA
jgi:hypothetical protein